MEGVNGRTVAAGWRLGPPCWRERTCCSRVHTRGGNRPRSPRRSRSGIGNAVPAGIFLKVVTCMAFHACVCVCVCLCVCVFVSERGRGGMRFGCSAQGVQRRQVRHAPQLQPATCGQCGPCGASHDEGPHPCCTCMSMGAGTVGRCVMQASCARWGLVAVTDPSIPAACRVCQAERGLPCVIQHSAPERVHDLHGLFCQWRIFTRGSLLVFWDGSR